MDYSFIFGVETVKKSKTLDPPFFHYFHFQNCPDHSRPSQNPTIHPFGSLLIDFSNKSREASFLVLLLLLDNLHHVHNKCLKLRLRDLPVPVRVQFYQNLSDVLLTGRLDIEGIGQSPEQLAQLMPLDVPGVVSVEGAEGVLEFLLGEVQNVLVAHSIILIDGIRP